VVGTQRRTRSVVENRRRQAGEEVEGVDSGFVERLRARAEVAVVTEEHVGGQRWRSMGRRPPQMKEAAGSVLQLFLATDSGSVASLAWLRGARERCAVVNASALGAEEHDDEGAEVDSERQSGVGGRSVAVARRGENDFSFGPTA
jgi:hypothetical protein